MNRSARAWIGLGALLVAVSVSWVGDARAAFIFVGDTRATGTLQDWIALGSTGVQLGDKLWVYSDSTLLPTTTAVTFAMFSLDAVDVYTLTIGRLSNTATGATLHYSIQIMDNGDNGFATATLDSTSTGGGTSVVETLAATSGGDTILSMTSLDGSPQVATPPSGLTYLDVIQSWTIPLDTNVNETFVTFTQGTVPEPAAITIWCLLLGGTAIGLRLRARKASAA